jgi:hypothetical protein
MRYETGTFELRGNDMMMRELTSAETDEVVGGIGFASVSAFSQSGAGSSLGTTGSLFQAVRAERQGGIREAEETDDPQWRKQLLNWAREWWKRPGAKLPISGLMILPSSFFRPLFAEHRVDRSRRERLTALVHDPRVELYASHEVQWMMRA